MAAETTPTGGNHPDVTGKTEIPYALLVEQRAVHSFLARKARSGHSYTSDTRQSARSIVAPEDHPMID